MCACVRACVYMRMRACVCTCVCAELSSRLPGDTPNSFILTGYERYDSDPRFVGGGYEGSKFVALTSQFNFIHICMIWALHGGLCGDYFGSAPDTHDTSFHFQTVWQELFRQPFNNKRR